MPRFAAPAGGIQSCELGSARGRQRQTSHVAFEVALGMWAGMAVSVLLTVCSAILAGRARSSWRVFPVLFLEFVLLGAAILFWMFLVWSSAKASMSIGISASSALVISIVIGIGFAVLTVVGVLRLVRAGYAIVGQKDRYEMDFGDSLWFGRLGTWRPKESRES